MRAHRRLQERHGQQALAPHRRSSVTENRTAAPSHKPRAVVMIDLSDEGSDSDDDVQWCTPARARPGITASTPQAPPCMYAAKSTCTPNPMHVQVIDDDDDDDNDNSYDEPVVYVCQQQGGLADRAAAASAPSLRRQDTSGSIYMYDPKEQQHDQAQVDVQHTPATTPPLASAGCARHATTHGTPLTPTQRHATFAGNRGVVLPFSHNKTDSTDDDDDDLPSPTSMLGRAKNSGSRTTSTATSANASTHMAAPGNTASSYNRNPRCFQLLIDNRERVKNADPRRMLDELRRTCTSGCGGVRFRGMPTPRVEQQKLQLGDFAYVIDDATMTAVCPERKTISDLVNRSAKGDDLRQMRKLREQCDAAWIVLEGDATKAGGCIVYNEKEDDPHSTAIHSEDDVYLRFARLHIEHPGKLKLLQTRDVVGSCRAVVLLGLAASTSTRVGVVHQGGSNTQLTERLRSAGFPDAVCRAVSESFDSMDDLSRVYDTCDNDALKESLLVRLLRGFGVTDASWSCAVWAAVDNTPALAKSQQLKATFAQLAVSLDGMFGKTLPRGSIMAGLLKNDGSVDQTTNDLLNDAGTTSDAVDDPSPVHVSIRMTQTLFKNNVKKEFTGALPFNYSLTTSASDIRGMHEAMEVTITSHAPGAAGCTSDAVVVPVLRADDVILAFEDELEKVGARDNLFATAEVTSVQMAPKIVLRDVFCIPAPSDAGCWVQNTSRIHNKHLPQFYL